ncbi:MAG: substrate-binding domain-containing protein [Rhodobacteraceae bacterium]|nr:substrate-binding domain-containing protein [Paracoccaceae bacterium]
MTPGIVSALRGLALGASLAVGATGPAMAETIRVATTSSFHNSGLSEVLLPAIEKEAGLRVQLLVVGTGQALRLGRAGDVDAVLVHSPAAEELFVRQGYGLHRRTIMHNDFVLIGPQGDPAAVGAALSAADAVFRVASARAAFVSRGDDSGTHRKEQELWRAAGLTMRAFGSWYKAVGAGMGAALNTAAGLDAYILSDRASWLNFGNRQNLRLLYSGDAVLFNQYSFLPVNPARHPHVQARAAAALEAWLTSPRAAALINGYTINGHSAFVFNAESP